MKVKSVLINFTEEAQKNGKVPECVIFNSVKDTTCDTEGVYVVTTPTKEHLKERLASENDSITYFYPIHSIGRVRVITRN